MVKVISMWNNNEAKEIALEKLEKMPKEDYIYVDVRVATAYQHGRIPGAINIDIEALKSDVSVLPKDKIIVIYCMKGIITIDYVDDLREKGYRVYSLAGGYGEWLIRSFNHKDHHKEIEKSLQKKFKREIFNKFTKALNKYDLLQEGDKVAVCISGGKDSMLMAKLFQELKRYNKFEFDLVFLVMDPGYNEINRQVIENNAKLMDIPLTIFNTNIFDAVFKVEKSPCYLCARMRRGHLYKKAKELGCNKIALGHHYDDVIETILMGMLYGAQVQTMMPKLHSKNFEGMELIRPMYLIREDDIIKWRNFNNLNFIQCACRFTDTCSMSGDGSGGSKRMEIKRWIRQLKETNPYVESNIFRSVENVNLTTIISYKENEVEHHFLETYNE